MKRILATYLLVGVLNTVVGYLLFAFFIFIGAHYTIAVLLATVLGVLFNFKTIGALVFKNHDNTLIFRFIAVYVVVYFLNILGLRIFKGYGVDMYLAGFVMIFPAAAISFLLHRNFVFRGTT